jgi:hypothetical protein
VAQIVSCLGLVLDILGAILIFRFGLPASINPEGHSFLLLEETDEAMKRTAARYDFRGRIGMYLLIAGFAGQLIGQLLDKPT